jgi:DNA-binding CsgD family transcriptional regulator
VPGCRPYALFMLYGRGGEIAVLDALVADAREHKSGSVLVRGAGGVGKTALLRYVKGQAVGLTMLWATGVQPESEIPFATLNQLLRPVSGLTDALPEAQSDALNAALGFADARNLDRLLVASAVLSLLGEAGAASGVLCVVDDLHWADRASVDALMFTARRLSAEGVAMVFADRAQTGREVPPEIAVLEVENLTAGASRELLRACVPLEPSEVVVTQLFEVTDGHPLALCELADALGPDVLTGLAPLPDPLPVTAGIEQAFLEQAQRLPSAVQLVLLVAALDSTGRVGVLDNAAERLGVGPEAVTDAEESGLLDLVSGTIAFRHPLVRSAVVAAASAAQRRLVHSALSGVLTDPADEERRVWHAAECVVGADDAVADRLEQAADRAGLRTAHSAAAKALTRSAELTVDQRVAASRYLRAARECWLAGQAATAERALDAATAATADPLLLAEVVEVKARLELYQGDASEAYRLLVEAAPVMATHRPLTALRMIFRAAEAALWTGNLAGVVRCGALADEVDPGDDRDAQLLRDIDIGLASLFTGGDHAPRESLHSLVTEAAGRRSDPEWLILAAETALALGRFADAGTIAREAVEVARSLGSTSDLPQALHLCALADHALGRYAAAAGFASQSTDLARETGQTSVLAAALAWSAATAAIRGDDAGCQAAARQAEELAAPRGLVLVEVAAAQALAHSDMIQARYGPALRRLTALDSMTTADATPSSQMFALGDRIEAAVRTGEIDRAKDGVARLEQWADATASLVAKAMALRCRALLGDGDPARLFSQSLAVHPEGEAPFERARTQLLFGEWLRRRRKRTEAREHLRAACETFERLGCEPLAARARGELRATGETMASTRSHSLASLTPQELAISRLVGEGASNRDAASVLYISPRTVEYHLHKIFTKLSVGSRTELAHLVASLPG